MTPERWRKVEDIFQTALDLSPDERSKYVFEICGSDESLRRDVQMLLKQPLRDFSNFGNRASGSARLGKRDAIDCAVSTYARHAAKKCIARDLTGDKAAV